MPPHLSDCLICQSRISLILFLHAAIYVYTTSQNYNIKELQAIQRGQDALSMIGFRFNNVYAQ